MAKYQVTKAVESRKWEVGDIVSVSGNLTENDVLAPYDGELPNKHVMVVVEPIQLVNKVNK